jgi:tetratricopeptide (TPR) repeat protein
VRLALHVQPAEVGRLGGSVLVDTGSKRAAIAALDALLADAEPDSVVASEAALPFLERRFELEAAAPGLYRLTGDERVGLRVGGRVTPMVGRGHELELLRGRLGEACAGRGQVVGVVGEAGIGKSRLVSELRRDLYGGTVLALEAQCLSHGSSIPYFPIRELLRRLFGLAEGDEPAAADEKICAGVRAMDGDVEAYVPWIRPLLGLPSSQIPAEWSPEAVQARTFAVLRTLAVQASRRTPLLMVVEDAHWIDRTSEDLLVSLAEAIAAERVLLLLTYRAGYRPPWIESPHATQISLPHLSPEESLAVVRAVLGDGPVGTELPPSILERAEGNPLFLEELARTAAAGTGSGAVPATLEAALAGRIQGLPENVRRVVQTASVLGRQFSRALLERVSSEAAGAEAEMRELKRLHLVQERVRLDGPLYAFRHALIQEAAYQSLPPSERQRVHAAAARALEERHADRPDAECELISHHYLRGGEPALALRYLELSNRKAARASAMPEAHGYLQQALEALERLPDTEQRRRRTIALLVDQALVMALLFRFDEYRDLLRRHETAALALDDPGLRGAFLACRGVCEWGVGLFDAAIASFAEAGELCEAAGYVPGAAQAHAVRQWAHLYKGEYQEVLDLLPSVRRVLEKGFIPRWEAYALGAAARACTYLGRWDAAVGYAREELALADRFSDDSLASHAALTLALAEGTWGELEGAVEHGELALRKAPTPADRMWARAILAWAWCRAGEPARGVDVLAAVVARSRSVRWQAGEFYAVWLGEALLELGQHERARQTLSECLAVAEEHGMAYLAGSAHRLLGEVARAEGTPAADAHFEEALRLLAAVGAENERALAHAGYGRLLAAQGLAERGREHLGRALEILERLGTRREPDRVRAELARRNGA